MVNINSSALSVLFAQVDSIQNPDVKYHLIEAQNSFVNAEKFNDPAWISYALSDLRSALRNLHMASVTEEINQECIAFAIKFAELKKERKLAHNQHKRTMKRMSDRFTNGKSVDYSSGIQHEEPWFDQQAPKQEVDLEDICFPKIVSFRGKPDQSKSKAKWQRSGKQARVLSNR